MHIIFKNSKLFQKYILFVEYCHEVHLLQDIARYVGLFHSLLCTVSITNTEQILESYFTSIMFQLDSNHGIRKSVPPDRACRIC